MSFWSTVLLLVVIEILNLTVYMVLPPGSMRRYAAFVMGVLTVYAMLGPILSFLGTVGERLDSGIPSVDLSQYQQIDWQDYVDWYIAHSNQEQE